MGEAGENKIGLIAKIKPSLGKRKTPLQPPQLKKTETDVLENNPSILESFGHFKQAELADFDPDELIFLGKNLATGEQKTLNAAGIDVDRPARRGDLLAAGFVFRNRIGGGEKPILNATVGGVNLGERVFLTQAEIDAVKAYQKAHPNKYQLPPGVDPEDVRHDMFSFLLASQVKPAFVRYHQLAQGIPSLYEHNKYANPIPEMRDPAAVRVITDYREHLYKDYQKRHPELTYQHQIIAGYEEAFVKEKCADVYTPDESYDSLNPKVRGIRASIIEQRRNKLTDEPSPFLDSGFHFGTNPDVFVMPEDSNSMRLNMVPLHLMSRGLSEMGDSKNGSHDQHYATVREYYDHVFPKDKAEREKLWESENIAVTQTEDRDGVLREIGQRFVNYAFQFKNENSRVLGLRNLLSSLRSK